MNITNMAQLERQMAIVMDNLMENLSTKLLKMLQDRIWRDTYNLDKQGNSYYYDGTKQPTFDFLNAWQWQSIQSYVKVQIKELFCNDDAMRYNGEPYGAHSSIFGQDVRDMLAEFLNINGTTSSIGIKERKAYWDNYIADLDKYFTNIAYEQLKQLGKQYGFTVKKA